MSSQIRTARDSLTRPRRSQLIDILVGLAALTAISVWVGRANVVLGIGIFVLNAGVYLFSLRQKDAVPDPVGASDARAGTPSSVGRALDQLESQVVAAPRLPLTGDGRIDPSKSPPLVAQVRAAAQGTSA